MKTRTTHIYANGVQVRSHNRRIMLTKNRRLRGGVCLEIYSVNKDLGTPGVTTDKHVASHSRMGRRFTGMNLSFDALRDIGLAIELYHTHIEKINEQTLFYDHH